MITTNTFVEIDIPEARDLADMTGIALDFKKTKRFATELKEILGKTFSGEIYAENQYCHNLVEPMTIAILVCYSRPFTTGVRCKLKENDFMEMLSPEQKTAHRNFRLWRDKHIAHSVNVFEDNQPVARYVVERFDDEGFCSVECNSSQIIGMSMYDVEMVIELTTHFIEELESRLKREKQKVLTAVRALPRQQVLGMRKSPHNAKIEDVSKTRKWK
uniref:Uncharacterized protein n=1 Tax=Candidatus Kentrum sp. TC TaxID=2126339 RepID=A0A450Z540_9GAMM|nr:MAG: hypothetical protein BECKTC1821E_GA0114239_11322 [Candidatus Kentron sp. TC]